MKFLLCALALFATQVSGQATINLPADGGVAVNWVASANDIQITITENVSPNGYTCFGTSYDRPASPAHNGMDTYCISQGRLYQGPSSNKNTPKWTSPTGFANSGDLAGAPTNVMTGVTITANNGQVTTTINRPQANKYVGATDVHLMNSNVGRFLDGQMYYEKNKVYTGMSITSANGAGFNYHSGGTKKYWTDVNQLLRVTALTPRTCATAKPCATTGGYTGNPNPTAPAECKSQNDCTPRECCEYIPPPPTAVMTPVPTGTASLTPTPIPTYVPPSVSKCPNSFVCPPGFLDLSDKTLQVCFSDPCVTSDCCSKDPKYTPPSDGNSKSPTTQNQNQNQNQNQQDRNLFGSAASFAPSMVTAVLVSVASLFL